MNNIQRITKNISVLLISQIFTYILAFLTLTYTARYLGVEGFGILSIALAFTGIFTVFLDLGTNTLIVRDIARDNSLAKEYTANTMFLRILLSLITLGSIFLISNIMNYNQEIILIIMIMAVYMIFYSYSNIFFTVFQAFEKMEYNSIGFLLFDATLLLGILLAIHYNYDIIKFSSVYIITSIITLLYAYLIFRLKFFTPKSLKLNKWKELINEAWPFAITGISFNIYTWIDSLLLSIMIGAEVVGFYNASYRLMLIFLFIPAIFSGAIFPVMSRYYISSKESLKVSFEKLLKILVLIALPITIGTTLIADKVILFIYGNEFLGSIIVLQILIWSTAFVFARVPYGMLLGASNRQLVTTKIFIIGVIFNIVLNILIIPKYSYVGAGVITVLTDALVLFLFIVVIRNEFSISRSTKLSLIKILLASIIMGISLNFFIYLNLFLIILLGILIYAISLILLKVVDEDELLMIKSLFNKS
jgi:O-antigen/teichoic acid export membrane protein